MIKFQGILLVLTFLFWGSCKNVESNSIYTVNIPDVKDIQRIQLVYRDGSIADLHKQSDFWTLNDSLRAWQSPVNTLLETLQRMRVRYIPTEASQSTILADLATQSVKVNLFDGKGLIRSFYIGGVTENEQGTYYISEPDGVPLVIEIPGWQGALRSRFVMNVNEWRDRYIFQGLSEVERIEVAYPQQEAASFSMEKGRNGWKLTLPIEAGGAADASASLINNYWFDLQDTGIESFEEAPADYRRILAKIPYCRITLYDHQGHAHQWSFYPVDEMGRPERYWIVTNKNEWMLGQTRILQKIFKSNAYFLQK